MPVAGGESAAGGLVGVNRRGFLGSLLALAAAPAVAALPSARPVVTNLVAPLVEPLFSGELGFYSGISIVESMRSSQAALNRATSLELGMLTPDHIRYYSANLAKDLARSPRPQPGFVRQKPGPDLADRRRWKGDIRAWA